MSRNIQNTYIHYNIGDTVTLKCEAGRTSRTGIIVASSNEFFNFLVDFGSGLTRGVNYDEIDHDFSGPTSDPDDKKPETATDPNVIRIDKNKEALKYDNDKVRVELIPTSAILSTGRAFTFGAKKYADHNWSNGFDYSRLLGAAMRHLLAYQSGEDKDPESGLSHLDHLGACVAMLQAHETEGLGNDDRRKTKT